jgi:hypothetical protein
MFSDISMPISGASKISYDLIPFFESSVKTSVLPLHSTSIFPSPFNFDLLKSITTPLPGFPSGRYL